MDWSDVLRAAASLFLVVTGSTLGYALIRAARALDHVTRAVDTTMEEVAPLFGKAGEALDQMSGQLENAERITGPAAEAVDAVERSARAVIDGVGKPITAVDRLMRRAMRRPRE